MLCVEDVGQQYGMLGSRGREYHLAVWRNPVSWRRYERDRLTEKG